MKVNQVKEAVSLFYYRPGTINICIIPVPELKVEAGATHQTIHSFGASDAWSCQFIGKYWPVEKREQIADWLFSTDMDEDNNPRGIGLTAWRFNIGGGSAFQGEASEIGDEWRKPVHRLRKQSPDTNYKKYDGEIYDSKLLWVMGNFSRFVKPGMTRVSVSGNVVKTYEQMMEDIMPAAFVSADKSKVTIVLINAGEEDIELSLLLKGLDGIGKMSGYITDSSPGGNLKYTGSYKKGDLLVVPGHSVTTITNQP